MTQISPSAALRATVTRRNRFPSRILPWASARWFSPRQRPTFSRRYLSDQLVQVEPDQRALSAELHRSDRPRSRSVEHVPAGLQRTDAALDLTSLPHPVF